MRILVTGGNGAMGKALRAYLPDALYLGHDQLDVTDQESVWNAIGEHSPHVVIHAAAITDHQCPDTGKLINTNVIATQHVAKAAGYAKLVYLSTHYVYPGERGNYRETAECHPIGAYAWSKLAGERIVQATCPNQLIIRGSWYTDEKLALWEKNGALADAWCSRLYVDEAAARIAKLVGLDAWGIYNIGTSIKWTFADLVRLNSSKKFRERRRRDLKLSYEFPKDSSVNTEKYDALVG